MVMAAVGLATTAYAAHEQRSAASDAADAQRDAAQQGIAQQDSRFNAVQKLLAPYVTAGNGAITGQQDLLGLNGMQAQQGAINGIQSSPMFGTMARQGEDAILQNASATGGLRGGNTQGALAQFRPALLNGLIDQQYSRLGGLTQIGQASAAGVGAAGMQTGNAITGLLGQQGAASAGQALADGRANSQLANGLANSFGNYVGGGMGSVFGGTGTAPPRQELF